jgi:hypothetical protein
MNQTLYFYNLDKFLQHLTKDTFKSLFIFG